MRFVHDREVDPSGTISEKTSVAWRAGAKTAVTTVAVGAAVAFAATISAPVTIAAGAAFGLYALTENYVRRMEQYDDAGTFDQHGEAFGVALGDVLGFTEIVEGANDIELTTGRQLSSREAGERLGSGIGQQLGTLLGAAVFNQLVQHLDHTSIGFSTDLRQQHQIASYHSVPTISTKD